MHNEIRRKRREERLERQGRARSALELPPEDEGRKGDDDQNTPRRSTTAAGAGAAADGGGGGDEDSTKKDRETRIKRRKMRDIDEHSAIASEVWGQGLVLASILPRIWRKALEAILGARVRNFSNRPQFANDVEDV